MNTLLDVLLTYCCSFNCFAYSFLCSVPSVCLNKMLYLAFLNISFSSFCSLNSSEFSSNECMNLLDNVCILSRMGSIPAISCRSVIRVCIGFLKAIRNALYCTFCSFSK